MGKWGYSTFESDMALDFLADVFDYCKSAIEKSLYGDDEGDPEIPVIPAIVCMRSLLESIPEAIYNLSSEKVSEWHQDYDNWLVENVEAEEELIAEQTASEEEFSKLLELIQKLKSEAG